MRKQILFILGCALALSSCGNRHAVGSEVTGGTDAKTWFDEGTWRQGWKVDACRSLDVAEFFRRHSANPERWNKAFHFLATTDLIAKTPGRYELDGNDLFAIVDEYPGKEPEDTRFEAHQVYADIQYVISGREYIGVMPLDSAQVVVPYDETRILNFCVPRRTTINLPTVENSLFFFRTTLIDPERR